MLYQEWKNEVKPEKKERHYQHIDSPLNLDEKKDFQEVIDALENIKNHQFLPFIKRDDVKIRFRKDKDGQVKRLRKIRPIKYASHLDSHIYSYYNFLLTEKYERYIKNLDINESIIAYRKIKKNETGKGKSNIHFAKEVFDYIKSQDECVIITQDIEAFFDNLNHKTLKEKICKINDAEKLEEGFYKVFRSLTAHRYIDYADFINKKIKRQIKTNKYAIYKTLKDIIKENKTNKGIPQGSPISGLLANIYLIDFDSEIKQNFPDVFYRRYSDDLAFICSKGQKDLLLEFIDLKIRKSSLNTSAKKSFISYFKRIGERIICERVTDGLDKDLGRNYVDYLGLEFDGENIFLRKSTIQKLKNKQIKKAEKQLLNTETPNWTVPQI